MLESFEWRDLKNAPIFAQPPDFVISTKWSDAGKIALALGPQIPVFVLSNDPRGWAFLDESGRFRRAKRGHCYAGGGSRIDPRRCRVRYLPSSDSLSFMRLVVAAAPRSSSRSSPLPA